MLSENQTLSIGNPCTYQDQRGKNAKANQSWQVVRKIGNLDTGVQQGADASPQFLGTELKPNQMAVMKSEDIRPGSQQLNVKYYEATKGTYIQVSDNMHIGGGDLLEQEPQK